METQYLLPAFAVNIIMRSDSKGPLLVPLKNAQLKQTSAACVVPIIKNGEYPNSQYARSLIARATVLVRNTDYAVSMYLDLADTVPLSKQGLLIGVHAKNTHCTRRIIGTNVRLSEWWMSGEVIFGNS